MRLLLIRDKFDPTFTCGSMSLPSGKKIHTLELPWLNNTAEKSCIPYGIYQCKKVVSPKFGNTFEVLNVPNRSHILFHSGNTSSDSIGCVLLGMRRGAKSILESKTAVTLFLEEMKCNEFELEIR